MLFFFILHPLNILKTKTNRILSLEHLDGRIKVGEGGRLDLYSLIIIYYLLLWCLLSFLFLVTLA